MTACVVRCFGCQNNLVPENTLKKGGYRTSEKKRSDLWVGLFPKQRVFMGKTFVTGYGRGIYGAMQRRCSRCLGTPGGLAEQL